MSQDVETKVVQMRFDNKKFEKNINQTIKSVQRLEDSLKFKGSKKEIEDLSKSLKEIETEKINRDLEKSNAWVSKIAIGVGDIIKIKVLGKIIDSITNKLAGTAKSILGINNIITGWQNYEEQLTTVGGILNNVKDSGKTIEDVAKAMDTLRWYTDETSFNFTALSNGIKQFTTAGAELDEATKAAIGVTSLAGASKVFDNYKIQSAMDAVSKSLQSGYMDVQRWTSLTNTAGIVTEEFSQILLETARAKNKLSMSAAGQYRTVKGGKLVTTENIRSTLSDKWLTGDVLTAALARYSSAVELVRKTIDEAEAGNLSEEMQNYLDLRGWDASDLTVSRTMDMLEELKVKYDEVGFAALRSSQETSTFTQAIQSAAVAVSTKWQNIFEKVFGDTEQAVELWSDVADELYETFVTPMNDVYDLFEKWNTIDVKDPFTGVVEERGGMQTFHSIIIDLVKILGRFKQAFNEAVTETFDDFNEGSIASAILGVRNWTKSLKENEQIYITLKSVAKSALTVFRALGRVIGSGFKVIFSILKTLSPVFSSILKMIEWASNLVVKLFDSIENLGILRKTTDALRKSVEKIVGAIADLFLAVTSKFDLEKFIDKLSNGLGKISDFITIIFESLSDGILWLIDQAKYLGSKLKNSEIIRYAKALFESIKNLFDLRTVGSSFKQTANDIKDSSKSLFDSVKTWLDEKGVLGVLKKVGEFFKSIVLSVWGSIKSAMDNVKTMADEGKITLNSIIDLLLSVAGVLTLISTMRAVWNIGKTFNYLSDLVWQLTKRVRAETWKAAAFAAVEIAGAVTLLILAVEKLSYIDPIRALESVGMIALIIGSLAGAVWLISKGSFTTIRYRDQVKTVIGLITIAGALAGLMAAIKILINATRGLSWEELAKAGTLFSIISFVLTSVMLAFKVPGRGHIPLLISFVKILGTMYLVLKATFWVLDVIKEAEYDYETIEQFAIIMASISVFLISVGVMIRLMNRSLTESDVVKAIKMSVNVTSTLTAISITVLAAIALVRLLRGFDWTRDWRALRAIIIMYGVIGAIVVAINKTSKLIRSKGLFKGEKIKNSPIGMTLLGLTATIGLTLIIFKLLKYVSWDEIKNGIGVFYAIFAAFLPWIITLGLFQKYGSAIRFKSIKKTLISMAILLGAMFAVVKISSAMNPEEISKGLKVVGALILFMTVAMSLMTLSTKFSDPTSMAKLWLTILAMAVGLAAVAGAFWILKDIDVDNLWTAMGVISILTAIMVAISTALGALAAYTGTGTAILVGIAIGVLAIAYSIKMTADALNSIDVNKLSDIAKALNDFSLASLTGAMALVNLPIMGAAVLAFAKIVSKIKSSAVENFSKLADALNVFHIDSTKLDSAKALNQFVKEFVNIAKNYKKISSSTMQALADDINSYISILNNIMESKYTEDLTQQKISYVNTINVLTDLITKIRALVENYSPLKKLSEFRNDLEVLFINKDAIIPSVLNGIQIDVNPDTISKVTSAMNNIISCVKNMTEIDINKLNAITDAEGNVTGTVLGGAIATLVTTFATAIKNSQDSLKGIDWSLADNLFGAMDALFTAANKYQVTESIFAKSGGLLGDYYVSETNMPSIPEGFGEAISKIVMEMSGALMAISLKAKYMDIDPEQVSSFAEIFTAAATVITNITDMPDADAFATQVKLLSDLVTNMSPLITTVFNMNYDFDMINTRVRGIHEMLYNLADFFEVESFEKIAKFVNKIGYMDAIKASFASFDSLLMASKDTIKTIYDVPATDTLQRRVSAIAGLYSALTSLGLSAEKLDKVDWSNIKMAVDYGQNLIDSFRDLRVDRQSVLNIKAVVETINEILKADLDVHPVITPVLDLSNVNSQLASLYAGYSYQGAVNVQASMLERDDIRKEIPNPIAKQYGTNPTVVNITENFNDAMMYSYDAVRSLRTSVQNAISKGGASALMTSYGSDLKDTFGPYKRR